VAEKVRRVALLEAAAANVRRKVMNVNRTLI
jgi:hypothetical protein